MANIKSREEKEVTLSDARVARELGLSKATVSRVLNNHPNVSPATQARVLKALHTAKGIRRARSGHVTLGVVIPDIHSERLNHIYIQDVLAGILQSATEYDFAIRTVDITAERQVNENYPQLLMRLGMNGLIHVAITEREFPAVLAIAEAGFPQCLIGNRLDHPGVSWIDAENRESSRKAIEYLIHLGHRRIAAVAARLDRDHCERLEGYRDAMTQAGIPIDPALTVSHDAAEFGIGYSTTMNLLARPDRPTAIYFTNNEMALGGIRACHKAGLAIPKDISLVTFSDSDVTGLLTPSLTFLRQPVFDIGRRAGKCLAEHVKHHEGEIMREIVVPEFFINESTGPCPEITG